MSNWSATAVACANIAFIKYWGNRNHDLRLPANGSISMNLAGLETRTRVIWDLERKAGQDSLAINASNVTGPGLQRAIDFLDLVRQLSGIDGNADVISQNNFPAGAGIASSAAAFAALALAATKAAGLDLSGSELSHLARRGSGSACRSIPGGFVEWQVGTGDHDSFATSIASPEHWPLVDCVAILSTEHKPTGSTEGHALAGTSPLQAARVADAPRRLEICRQAIRQRDFEKLADIVELDSNLMHAVMQTSSPPLLYWLPETVAIMQAVRDWRRTGLPVCYTIDAGPNVHVICEAASAEETAAKLASLPGVREVRQAPVGGKARLIEETP